MPRRLAQADTNKEHKEPLETLFSSLSIATEEEEDNWGLDDELKRKLLTDLHEAGGFSRCSFANLVRHKQDVYGAPGSRLYTKVRNQFYRWKRQTTSRFESTRARLLPESSANLPAAVPSGSTEQPQQGRPQRARPLLFIHSPPATRAARTMNADAGMPWEHVVFNDRK